MTHHIDHAIGSRTTVGRIQHRDAWDMLASLMDASVDHAILDPPFDAWTHAGARYGGAGKDGSLINFAPLGPGDVARLVGELLRVSRRWVLCFCADLMMRDYADTAGEAWIRAGFWRKPDGAPQFSGDRPAVAGEQIAIMHRSGRKRWNGGGKHAFWSVPVERRDRMHPTQKPLRLMLALVEDFTDPGELILDPFAGSGTTALACQRLGRRFVGCELDAETCARANARLEAEAHGQTLTSALSGQETLW